MPTESIQQKLARVRKPRVHITYNVEVGNAIEEKELPFVVGVFADLAGHPAEPLAKVKDRKLVEIDGDNFSDVMAGMQPRLAFRVPNKITNDGTELGIELEFRNLDDFTPEAVAQRVEPLRKLVQGRQRLNELALKVNASERLEELLQEVVNNTDALKAMTTAGQPEGSGEKEE